MLEGNGRNYFFLPILFVFHYFFFEETNLNMVLSIFIVISGPLLSVTSINLFGVWLGLEVNLFAFLIIINFDGY